MKKFILAHGSEVPVSRMGGLIALILWWGKAEWSKLLALWSGNIKYLFQMQSN